MPDITKCINEECPIKDKCWRFTSPNSMYQAVSTFKYEDGCRYYWPNSDMISKPKKSENKNERSV